MKLFNGSMEVVMKWYEIINKSPERAEIWIYEQIGEDFWSGNGITAKKFQEELAEIRAPQIDLHINSPGGEVFSGLSIYNLLKQHPANVTTYIDGLAASIASVIALAGDKVIMAENALYMVHNPWGMEMGDANAMRKMAERLDKVGGSIALAYISKSGKSEAEIAELMNAETWMTADEAKEAGFADEISEQMDMAACVKFVPIMQKAKFKNIPKNLAENIKPPDNERDFESFLRDSGYTRKQAQLIIARGFKGVLRDSEQPESQNEPKDALRDSELPKPKRDRIADLLVRAEMVAPSL
jgi:ATP-dependent Clp endopeptidase proteolytic subunit ClpP